MMLANSSVKKRFMSMFGKGGDAESRCQALVRPAIKRPWQKFVIFAQPLRLGLVQAIDGEGRLLGMTQLLGKIWAHRPDLAGQHWGRDTLHHQPFLISIKV